MKLNASCDSEQIKENATGIEIPVLVIPAWTESSIFKLLVLNIVSVSKTKLLTNY